MTTKAALALLVPLLTDERPELLELLVEFEGYRTVAYEDVAGNVTIGVGHRLPPGTEAGTLRWSATQIANALGDDLDAARRRFPAYVMGHKRTSALTSLAFNVGDLHGSKLVALLDGGAGLNAVVREWVTWDHGAGRLVPGLLLRRLREATLYVDGYLHD